MGIVVRQSIKSSVISYIGIAIGAFNILWLCPKFLKPEEFGLIRLLQDVPFIIALFVQLGATGVTDRFFHHFKDDKKNNGFLNFILLYPLIGYSIFIMSFFIFNDFWKSLFISKSDLLIDYFIYLLPLSLFMMYTAIMEAYLRAHLTIHWSNFIRDVLTRIFFTTFTFLYALKLVSFETLNILIVVGYACSLGLLFIYAKKLNILHFENSFRLPEKKLLKEIRTYLFFLIPGAAGSLIAHKIDTIMLALLSGSEKNEGLRNVAIYSIAYFIGSVVEVPKKNIAQITVPLLSMAFKDGDTKQIETLYKKNSITQFASGVFIFLLIWINIDDFFYFIPNNAIYLQGKYVILFIGFSKLFDMITGINGEIILFSKYYKFNLITIILLSFFTVIFNLIFIPLYSVTGVAIALAITVFFYNVFKTWFVWNKMKMSPFSKEMIPLAFLCIITISLTFIPIEYDQHLLFSFLRISLRTLLFCILFYIIVRKFNISEELNGLINKILEIISNKTGIKWLKNNL